MTRPVQGALFRPDRRRIGRIRRGLDETLTELRRSDRIDHTHAAMVALCRVLADEMDDAMRDDEESRFVRARVASTYQAALVALLEAGAGEGDTSQLDAMLSALLDPTDTDTPH